MSDKSFVESKTPEAVASGPLTCAVGPCGSVLVLAVSVSVVLYTGRDSVVAEIVAAIATVFAVGVCHRLCL